MTKNRVIRRVGLGVAVATLALPATTGVAWAAGPARSAAISAPPSVDFGTARVGVGVVGAPILITNTGALPVMVPSTGISLSGPQASEFFAFSGSTLIRALHMSATTPATTLATCEDLSGTPTPLLAGASCLIAAAFLPTGFGLRQATLTVTASDSSTTTISLSGVGGGGYYLAGTHGETLGFGDAPVGATDPRAKVMSAPVAGVAATTDGDGYWTTATDGSVYPSGDALPAGSLVGQDLTAPVVGIAGDPLPAPVATPSTSTSTVLKVQPTPGAYWLAASDGGVFAFNAPFLGSEGGSRLNRPVVGIASSPDGAGYWLVASDGGVFAFGDAGFFGSTGDQPLNKPVVAVIPTPTGQGYWLVAADGGVFAFGDAVFEGSLGGAPLNSPIVGGVATPTGDGYWLVAADGGAFALGDAAFFGSLPGQDGIWHGTDVVGIAATTQPLIGLLLSGSTALHARSARVLSVLAGKLRVLPVQR